MDETVNQALQQKRSSSAKPSDEEIIEQYQLTNNMLETANWYRDECKVSIKEALDKVRQTLNRMSPEYEKNVEQHILSYGRFQTVSCRTRAIKWYVENYGGTHVEAKNILDEVWSRLESEGRVKLKLEDEVESSGCVITILIMLTATSLTSLLFL